MTITEAAAALGVSRKYIYGAIKRGELVPLQSNPLYRRATPGVRIPRDQIESLKRQAQSRALERL